MPNLDLPMGDRAIAELLKNKNTETGAALAAALNGGSGGGGFSITPDPENPGLYIIDES